jgi:hypothetical protein
MFELLFRDTFKILPSNLQVWRWQCVSIYSHKWWIISSLSGDAEQGLGDNY